MKTRIPLAIEQHKQLGAWINSQARIMVVVDVINAVGISSPRGKRFMKASNMIERLRSDLEDLAFSEGHGDIATSIYYPRTGEMPK